MSDQSSRSTEPETFKDTVRNGRKAAGLSQDAMAEALNVAQATISAWESGATYPSPGRVFALAELLGLDGLELHRLIFLERAAAEVPA